MKTRLLFTLLLVGIFSYTSRLQNLPTYPIPSYNILLDGSANFRNLLTQKDTSNNCKEKRDIHIHLKSTVIGNTDCRATVWVYTLDQSTILGPYQIACDQTLTVPIDEREWGVIVQTDDEVLVDVWFD